MQLINSIILTYFGLWAFFFHVNSMASGFIKQSVLIAPAIGGLESCLFDNETLLLSAPSSAYTKLCLSRKNSASGLINATLDSLSNNKSKNRELVLGYTLPVSILRLYDYKDNEFIFNEYRAASLINTIREVNKPVILYLFSNHFSVNSPNEDILARADENILQGPNGRLPIDNYFGIKIYPWSFVNLNNKITKMREFAFRDILKRVCQMPTEDIGKIKGVTVLGELHHMYPKFQFGMTYDGDFNVSDYSNRSREGFREYLVNKFKNISELNKHLQSNFEDFSKLNPPSKDIRTQKLGNYWEHIDNYGNGTVPISGWIAQNGSAANIAVLIFLNEKLIAKIPVKFSRLDVLAVHPKLKTAVLGWSYDLKYADIIPGIYNLNIRFENLDKKILHLATKKIIVMGRNQSSPVDKAIRPSSEFQNVGNDVLYYVDSPQNLQTLYFNPLTLLWNEFRKSQVTKYLSHFQNIVKSSCINADKIFSFQIIPFVHAGWNSSKYALGSDLAVPKSMQLGVSLYGEPAYGSTFFDWFQYSGRKSYGLTEFHPLKAMTADELKFTFERHRKNGAQFISMFMEPIVPDPNIERKSNFLSFDPLNAYYGSSALHKALVDVLNR